MNEKKLMTAILASTEQRSFSSKAGSPHSSFSSNHSKRQFKNHTAIKSPVALKNWHLEAVSGDHAIKVCGISVHNDKPRTSGPISMRIDECTLTSKNGTVYKLIGPMCSQSNQPSWFTEVFHKGFLPTWKETVFKYLEWLHDVPSHDEYEEDQNNPSGSKDAPEGLEIKYHLFKWAIHIAYKNIVVEGFIVGDGDAPQLYRTGAVMEAITSNVIRTISGSIYLLKGPLCWDATLQASTPGWLASKFFNGFPANWSKLLRDYIKIPKNGNSFNENAADHSDLAACDQTTSLLSHKVDGSSRKKHVPHLDWVSILSDEDCELSDLSTIVHVPNTVKKTRGMSQIAQKHVANIHGTFVRSLSWSDLDDTLGEPKSNKIDTDEMKDDLSNTLTEKDVMQTELSTKSEDQGLQAKPELVQTDVVKSGKKSKRKIHSNSEKAVNAEVPILDAFYRTRSGRHVFPPLQHWAKQRLIKRYDRDGNDIVVFCPGDKSTLKEDQRSPAAEAIRTTGWIQRKLEADMIKCEPSRDVTSESLHKRKNRKVDVSRKKQVAAGKSKLSNAKTAAKGSNTSGKKSILETESVCSFNGSSVSITNCEVRLTRCSLPLKQHAVCPPGISKSACQQPPTEKPGKPEASSAQSNDLYPNSASRSASRSENRGKHRDVSAFELKLLKDNQLTSDKLRPRRSATGGEKKIEERKGNSSNKTKQGSVKSSESSKAPAHSTKKQNKSVRATTGAKVSAAVKQNCKPKSVKRKNPDSREKRRTKRQKMSEKMVAKDLQKENEAENQGKNLKVTARRGTVKQRKQIKEVLQVLSCPKVDQDLFSSDGQTLDFFSGRENNVFDMTDAFSNIPFTPNTKLPVGMDPSVKTPAWFKTPGGYGDPNFSVGYMKTPGYLKSSCPDKTNNDKTADAADKAIVQLRKERKRNRKASLPRSAGKSDTKPRQNREKLPSNLFQNTKEEDEESDQDEYFSDA